LSGFYLGLQDYNPTPEQQAILAKIATDTPRCGRQKETMKYANEDKAAVCKPPSSARRSAASVK
jgi:hypothetical protein